MNKTSPLVYAIWPSAIAIVCVVLGIFYHPSFSAYAVAGGVWALGIIVMLYQIQKGGDTTLLPYIIQFAAGLIFGIWVTS
jgi:hypothetical protein